MDFTVPFDLVGWFGRNKDGLRTISAIASTTVTILLAITAFRVGRRLTRPQQISNIAEFLNRQYFDLDLNLPKGDCSKLSENFLTGVPLKMRFVRGKVESITKSQEPVPLGGRTPYHDFLEMTKAQPGQPYSWQNLYAYELSIALEHVGATVIMGAIPIEAVMQLASYQILRDWSHSYVLAKTIQKRENWIPHNHREIGFHRRHAEWLALAAAVHISTRWHLPDETWTSIIAPFQFGNENKVFGIREIQGREKVLRELEVSHGLLSKQTNADINESLYGKRICWIGKRSRSTMVHYMNYSSSPTFGKSTVALNSKTFSDSVHSDRV